MPTTFKIVGILKFLFNSLFSPRVVWTLSPAVEASLHRAASAFCVVEESGSSKSPSQNFHATKERRLNRLINGYHSGKLKNRHTGLLFREAST